MRLDQTAGEQIGQEGVDHRGPEIAQRGAQVELGRDAPIGFQQRVMRAEPQLVERQSVRERHRDRRQELQLLTLQLHLGVLDLQHATALIQQRGG